MASISAIAVVCAFLQRKSGGSAIPSRELPGDIQLISMLLLGAGMLASIPWCAFLVAWRKWRDLAAVGGALAISVIGYFLAAYLHPFEFAL